MWSLLTGSHTGLLGSILTGLPAAYRAPVAD